jgi:hypothetical protein
MFASYKQVRTGDVAFPKGALLFSHDVLTIDLDLIIPPAAQTQGISSNR